MKKNSVFFMMAFCFLVILQCAVYAKPANSSFKDDNFYQAVIEALNREYINSINDRDSNYCATDEELAKLSALEYGTSNGLYTGKKLVDTSGLEKLTGLRTLRLKYPDISQLDITHNTNLTYIEVLNANNLHHIDFSNNTKLITIRLTYTHLDELNLKNCPELKNLTMGAGSTSGAMLENLDLSNCPKLEVLDICGSKLKEVNLENNAMLRNVTLTWGNINKIVLPKNSNISTLALHTNDLKSLDDIVNIETCSSLNTLYLMNNHINDISKLKDIPNIETFSIRGNSSEIVVKKDHGSVTLPELFQEARALSSLAYSETPLEVETMGNVKATLNDTKISYRGAKNGDTITVKIMSGNAADVYNNNNEKVKTEPTIVTYVFMQDDETDVGSVIKDKAFYEAVINALNKAKINDISDRNMNYRVTDEELKQITSIDLGSFDGARVDDLSGLNKLTGLKSLSINYSNTTQLDISKNINLEKLTVLNANNLHHIDFLNNTKLKTLDLTYTHIDELNMSNCPDLLSIQMGAGVMTRVPIKKLNLSNCTNLKSIAIHGSYIEEVNLENNSNLTKVELTDGDIRRIILPKQSNLYSLDLINNQIDSLDDIVNLANCQELSKLILCGNKIKDATVLNKLPSLWSLSIGGNDSTIYKNASFPNGSIELPNIIQEALKSDSRVYSREGVKIETDGSVIATLNNTSVSYKGAKKNDAIILTILSGDAAIKESFSRRTYSPTTIKIVLTELEEISNGGEDCIKVLINGNPISFQDANGKTVNPQIVNDRTMVPMRKIFEVLGTSVEWDENIRSIHAKKDDEEIELQIDNPVATLKKQGITQTIILDVAPMIVEDRTLVPVRFIAESLGKKVDWDESTRTVLISD